MFFFSLELKILLTDGRSHATEIQDNCLPFLATSAKQGQPACTAIPFKQQERPTFVLWDVGVSSNLKLIYILSFHDITHPDIGRFAGQPENWSFCGPLFSVGG